MRVEWEGVDEVRQNLGLAIEVMAKAAAAGCYAVAQNIRTNSMARVPLDKGALKNSHHVTTPEPTGDGGFVVTVGCGGGPARPYALIQHERLDYRHPEGEAKFLEKAALEEGAKAAEVMGNQAKAWLQRLAAKGGSDGG